MSGHIQQGAHAQLFVLGKVTRQHLIQHGCLVTGSQPRMLHDLLALAGKTVQPLLPVRALSIQCFQAFSGTRTDQLHAQVAQFIGAATKAWLC